MKSTILVLLTLLLSLQLIAQTSADSVTVAFRCYYSSGTTVTVPGEFNGWSSSASPMTYNSSLQCWTRSFVFKTHASGRTLADSVYQYKFYQGGTWTSDPLNQDVNTADNNNSILRMSKLFWFDYNQFLSGTNITRMTVSLVHANSDNISSVMLSYGINANATLTTVDVTSGFDASKRIWDWTLGTSIPKANYIRLVAINNHGDSTVYSRGGYIWYYRTMPAYVLNGVTLPSVASNDSTSFRLRVSNKDYVLLRIAPTGQPVATATPIPLNHDNGNDNWWINVKLAAGTYEYVYEIENNKQIMDPWGRYIGTNGTKFTVGAEGLTADNYPWHSTSYQRPPLNKLVIYEMNPMEFAGGYYNIAANQVNWLQLRSLLPYLDSLGVNAIELMPVTDFSSIGYSGFSWGYDINSYFALEPTFGTPASFKQFVDSAHSRGISIIMDMVFNHLNETSTLWQMQPDESLNPYFKLCTDLKYNEDNLCFFRDLDHWTPETQELIYSSLKMWIDQYHIDGFRYDYTQGIGWNQSDTTYGVLGWANKIARDYNNTVYQIAEHLPESPALIYYSGMTGSWHGNFREKLFNEAASQNTSLVDYENLILGLGSIGTNDYPGTPSNYADRTEPVNDCSNHDEQSLFYEMIHYQHIDTATALKRDRLYSTFMFTSLGIPMLWEGIEFGAPRGYDGNKLDYRPVEWNYYKTANGKTQFQYYHTLVMQRKYNPALYQGNLVTQYRYESDRVLVWGFNDPVTGAQVEVIANLSGSSRTETNVPWLSAGVWYDVFDQSIFNAPGTSLPSFTIPAYTARVFTNRSNSDLGMPSPASISGTKYQDMNGDSSIVGDIGLNGWVIKLYKNCNLVARKVTDSNGNYKFDSLTAGTYTVEESLKSGWVQTFPRIGSANVITTSCGANSGTRSYSIAVTLNTNITAIDFANTQYGRICGVQFRDDNGNGQKDSGEPGLNNWTIQLSGPVTTSTITDTSGNYCFSGIPPGTYSLSEVQQPDWICTTPNYPSIVLTSGEQNDIMNFGNYLYGNFSGIVFNDFNGDGTQQLTDSALLGWHIYLEKIGQPSPLDSVVTGSDGLFTFDSLTYGKYILYQENRSGWTQSTPTFDTIIAVSGTILDTMNFGNVYASLTDIPMIDKWNMVSLPLHVSNSAKSILYPTSVSSAFKYIGSYIPKDTIENRIGYWLKFTTAQTVRIAGNLITSDTIPVTTNWNMIGSISYPIPVSSITGIPSGIVTSPFYTFNHGYNPSDTILPGRAYWVKSNQAGVLILSSTGLLRSQNRISILSTSELPPPPPTDENVITDIPTEFSLGQNYPNPFNPVTIISYALPANNFVTLNIYNLLGQQVATLVHEIQGAGWHEVSFDASSLPSGIYMYRIQAGEYSELKKLVVMK